MTPTLTPKDRADIQEDIDHHRERLLDLESADPDWIVNVGLHEASMEWHRRKIRELEAQLR